MNHEPTENYYIFNTHDCIYSYHYNFIPGMTLQYVNDSDPKLNRMIDFMKFSFEKKSTKRKLINVKYLFKF